MGQDPTKTKNRNCSTGVETSPPLLGDAYTTEIRYRSSDGGASEGAALRHFLQSFRSDGDRGYLRIIDTDNAEVWYVKWKWTAGRWAGHYVFDSCADGDLPACLRRLRAQVADVRTGGRKPTKDKQYG